MEDQGLKRHRLQRRASILPDEVLLEIISRLLVKHVMQLRCINKFFKNLIFDPHFVDLHLNKSTRNSQKLALMYVTDNTFHMETLSIPLLLRNKYPIFHHHTDPDRLLNDYSQKRDEWVVDSCNGLVCLFGISYPSRDQWICLWNPATRTKSKKFTTTLFDRSNYHPRLTYSFGYDNLTRTYKVVAFYKELDVVEPGCNLKSVIKVLTFNLGDDHNNSCWRDIQCCFPVLPIYLLPNYDTVDNKGVHLNGTINWIVLRDYSIKSSNTVTVNQFLILSLDLSTEKCTPLLLPQRFNKVPSHQPKLAVLMDRLCFCHDFEETYFVIWQMKNFGGNESWIQLFQISYQEKLLGWVDFSPLYLSQNHDTLVLANADCHEAFIYNLRYNQADKIRKNKVDKIGITNNYIVWSEALNYVESLVSTH